MSLLEITAVTPAVTEAQKSAEHNWSVNHQALMATQPEILDLLPGQYDAPVWTFARDGSLSALDKSGQWISGCSLPQRATEMMIRELEVRGTVACFLNPTHAAQLHVVLEKIQAQQAIIALAPNIETLALILHCHDFADCISSQRLWFAAGDDWPAQLRRFLTQQSGLPIPSSFIRLITTPETLATEMIAAAQTVFSHQSTDRDERIKKLASQHRRRPMSAKPRICAIAPASFRLWDDGGHALAMVLERSSNQLETTAVNPDNPSTSSPLAIAIAASDCDALIALNYSRADAPQLLPDSLPWITWLTTPKIPSYQPAFSRDHLLVADESWIERAAANGWPTDQLHTAAWPLSAEPVKPATGNILSIIANTLVVDPHREGFDLSSHRLLWEYIHRELSADPFAIGPDITRYLTQRARKLSISDEEINRRLFIDELIVPLYQQGMARTLIKAGFILKIFGRGWNGMNDFVSRWAGPVDSREDLAKAIAQSAALVNVWPLRIAHSMDAVGRPVLHAIGSDRQTVVREAKALLKPTAATQLRSIPTLTGELIARIISATK